jgi:hypothetical protein
MEECSGHEPPRERSRPGLTSVRRAEIRFWPPRLAHGIGLRRGIQVRRRYVAVLLVLIVTRIAVPAPDRDRSSAQLSRSIIFWLEPELEAAGIEPAQDFNRLGDGRDLDCGWHTGLRAQGRARVTLIRIFPVAIRLRRYRLAARDGALPLRSFADSSDGYARRRLVFWASSE